MPTLDAERIFYAAAFGIGLLLTVYAMLHGSVRAGHAPGIVKPPPAAFNMPVVGAATTALGATGYLFAKYSRFDTIPVILIALTAAGLGWIGMTTLMAKWALRGPLNDPHEEIEELQGTIATVTRAIGVDDLGEISYYFRGAWLTAPARNIAHEPVDAGTEVVIEKIEDGVADVELWSVVELRI